MIRLRTDFNDIDSDDTITALVRAATPRPPAVGDVVLLHDDGQHEAWGKVTSIDHGVIAAVLDWDTWADAGAYRDQSQEDERRRVWTIVTNATVMANTVGGTVRVVPRRPAVGIR